MEEFGNYWIERVDVIGNGSFGKVEKIRLYNHSKTYFKEYALKAYSPDPRIPKNEIEMFRQRFAIEVECQSKCFHNNITHICIHNRFQNWFVMELADCSLSEELDKDDCVEGDRKLTIPEKIDIFLMVLNGVKHIHDMGFIHRDIKALNILKYSDGSYKVSDFGLVKDTNKDSSTLTAIRKNLGTERYMSPEILAGIPHSIQSDIFALGVLLEDLALTETLEPIWRKCTERKPKDRYSNVQEIINDIQKQRGYE